MLELLAQRLQSAFFVLLSINPFDPSNFQMACLAYSLIESHNFYDIGSARWKVTNALLSCKNKGCVHIDLTSSESLSV
jgi:hypothetical protein